MQVVSHAPLRRRVRANGNTGRKLKCDGFTRLAQQRRDNNVTVAGKGAVTLSTVL